MDNDHKKQWQEEVCRVAGVESVEALATKLAGITIPPLGMDNPNAQPAPRFINEQATQFVPPPPEDQLPKHISQPPDEIAEAIALAIANASSTATNDGVVQLGLDQHIFVAIAQCRATRWLWAALNKKQPLILHAIGPRPVRAEKEDWNHLLINVAVCFAAISGGANQLSLFPHRRNDSEAERLTKNIWRIAVDEAGLTRSHDPAAGSWLVEQLTRSIAQQAWKKMGQSSPLSEKTPPPPSPTITKSDEQIDIHSHYTKQDRPSVDDSLPGQIPFRRGPYAAMYLTRPWTIRQYAGFSTAEDSNEFYRHALANGQKGLSVAFDLPTHRGYDSDNHRVATDVGMAGVAIDCLDDMRVLFNQIPLDEVSVSMTMNGAVLPIMALYIAAAAEQNVPPEKLAGTIQNDILKEFMVRNTYIYPPEPSMRIVADIFAYAAKHMPKFNVISISGYHMQEAGATKDLELAYTLADGMEYVRAGLKAGMAVDQFAPRLSFFWCIGMDFFMEVAKMRAARLLWADIMRGFGATNEKSLALRTHCQTSGWSLTARDPFNNITRTCIEAMAAVCGGTQSLHTNSLDEALALPSRFAAKLARDTQLFLQKETDLCKTIDGWGGSYYVERLTEDIAGRARELINEVEQAGGMTQAIAAGLPKKRIEEAATRTQAKIDKGERLIVGVNHHQIESEKDIEILKVDNMAVRENQLKRLKAARGQRNPDEVARKLTALEQVARYDKSNGDDGNKNDNHNLLAACVEAAKAGATVGEMSAAMEQVFTRYQAKPLMVKGIYAEAGHGNQQLAKARERTASFKKQRGFAPRILIAKAGQDGHDRGQKTIAAAYSDIGFDVVLGPLFQTAEQVAEQAIKHDVHIVAISSLAGAHLPLARDLIQSLNQADRGDIMVVIGGIIPTSDVVPLKNTGVDAIYPPGSDVSASAVDLLERLRGRN